MAGSPILRDCPPKVCIQTFTTHSSDMSTNDTSIADTAPLAPDCGDHVPQPGQSPSDDDSSGAGAGPGQGTWEEFSALRESGQPPWPGAYTRFLPVVLSHIQSAFRSYLEIPDPETVILSLWVAHTYFIAQADFTPYLNVYSPDKGCGKTRVLDLLAAMVLSPSRSECPSPAAIYGQLSSGTHTLLLDEMDAVFGKRGSKSSEALRGVLNSGYKRGGCVSRYGGASAGARLFNTFSPKAISGIGTLPDTVAQRSIPIRMDRRVVATDVRRFREGTFFEEMGIVRDALKIWSKDCVCTGALAEIQPPLPSELGDRQADISEPLLAIAVLAGGEWAENAQTAILEVFMRGRVDSPESPGVQLLIDIRLVAENESHISTEALLDRLVNLDTGAPWARKWEGALQGGRKLTAANDLAALLKPFGIHPKTIRIDSRTTKKGYDMHDFNGPWAKYCGRPVPTGAFADSDVAALLTASVRSRTLRRPTRRRSAFLGLGPIL